MAVVRVGDGLGCFVEGVEVAVADTRAHGAISSWRPAAGIEAHEECHAYKLPFGPIFFNPGK